MLRRLVDALFPVARLRPEDRWTVGIMWLVGILQGYAQSQLSATIPFTRVALGLTEAEMSLVLALTRVAGIGALLFSWWGDTRGRRRPFLVAYLVLMAASTGTALVTDPVQLTALQSLSRLATASVGTLGLVLLAERVGPHERAFAISLYGAGASFGAGLGLVALPLADLGPEAWRIPFAISGVGFLALPLILRRVDESRVFRATAGVEVAPLRDLLRSRFARWFWLSAMAGTLASSFTAVALAFSTERLVNHVGLSTITAVAISLAGGAVGGLGFFVGGRLADLVGRRLTTIVALAAMVTGGVALYWVEHLAVLTVVVIVSTFGSFAYVPAAGSHRVELFPTGFRSTAGAAGSYLAMLGSAAGLLVGRFAIERVGLSGTVTLLGTAVVVAILLTLLLPETRGRELDQVGREPSPS